ncbi:MAG: hypothetical protein WEF86_05700 [Gemmatimonadota bacterium]
MLFNRRIEEPDLVLRVQTLQVAALQSTIPGEAAAPLNKAGDLLLQSGDLAGALDLYGRAVDSMVEADRYEAATGLCRKIIRTAPGVVRARCTLAWLAIGAGFTGELESRLAQYIAAAEVSGMEEFARREVRRMSVHAVLDDVRVLLGEHMLKLGDDEAANELFGSVYRARNAGVQFESRTAETWPKVRGALLARSA